MSFTVAFLILAAGIALGYVLPGPLAKLKAFLRRLNGKPVLLRRYTPRKNPAETKPKSEQ